MTHIITTLDTLQACARFAGKEETRPYLNGVFIERDRMTATDGRALIHIKPHNGMYWDNGEFTPFILPAETIKAIKVKAKRFETVRILLDTTENRLYALAVTSSVVNDSGMAEYLVDKGLSLSYQPIEGTFPEYKRVIPAEHQCLAPHIGTGFSPAYLGLFDFLPSISIYTNENEASPAIIRGKHDHFDALGVLMSTRNAPNMPMVPEWFTYPTPTTKTEEAA
jgi:hypothetical protein